jgi:hypothetical protein
LKGTAAHRHDASKGERYFELDSEVTVGLAIKVDAVLTSFDGVIKF